MLVYALGIYDGPPERYETYTLSCPKGEACTVFIRTVDGDQGGLDTRTATMTVKVEDAFGQQVYTKAAEAWAFPQFSNDRTFNLSFTRLEPGTYVWSVDCTIGGRTCQILRPSSLTVLP